MANILCIETASTNCSVAVSVNGNVKALIEDNPTNKEGKNFSHAEKLHQYIEEALKQSGIKISEVNAIAVSKGPGSYTGLRIGVSAAKGLCYALNIPLISILTLRSLASKVKETAQFIVPMLDARRMEVYTAVYSKNEEVEPTKAKVLSETSFSAYLDKGKTIFVGDGAKKFEEICAHPNATFVVNMLPSANEMAKLAEAKYKISDTEDVAYFEPFYLKDFIAK